MKKWNNEKMKKWKNEKMKKWKNEKMKKWKNEKMKKWKNEKMKKKDERRGLVVQNYRAQFWSFWCLQRPHLQSRKHPYILSGSYFSRCLGQLNLVLKLVLFYKIICLHFKRKETMYIGNYAQRRIPMVLGKLRVLRVKTCKLRVTCKTRNPHRIVYGLTRNYA